MYRKSIVAVFMFMLICSGCAKSPPVLPEKRFEQTQTPVNGNAMPTLIIAARSNDFNLIKDLLRSDANANVKDDKRKSALWYAFESESFEAFKVLLEQGAHIDFKLSYKTVSDSYNKLKFYKLVKEYDRFNKIKYRGNNNDLSVFDAYFSEFSNGHYVTQVVNILEQIVKDDYKRASSGSALQQFIRKYSALGQNGYLIIASDLNIRAGNSINTARTGEYDRGEKVFAIRKKGEWIETDRGWVNAKYVKQIKKSIPVLQPYLQKAADKLGQIPVPYKTDQAQPATELQKSEVKPRQPEIAPPKRGTNKKISEVQKELDRILKNPTLSELETFIKRYKNNSACRSLVNKAREKYKKILLGDM